MKRIIVAFGLLLAGNASKAQEYKHTLGVQTGGFALSRNLKSISPAAGLFYDHRFSSLFGIGVSVLYHKFYSEGIWYGASTETSPDGRIWLVKFRHNYLDIPLNLKLSLNKPEAQGWRTDFLVGATYSQLLETVLRDTQTGEKLVELEPLPWQKRLVFLNLGLEFKTKMSENSSFGINPGVQGGVSDNTNDSFFYLNLRFGRNL